MKLWTKYPLNKATDESATYLVDVVAWDENRYCFAWWNGKLYNFKLWYCYLDDECLNEIRLSDKLLKRIPGRTAYFCLLDFNKNPIKEQA